MDNWKTIFFPLIFKKKNFKHIHCSSLERNCEVVCSCTKGWLPLDYIWIWQFIINLFVTYNDIFPFCDSYKVFTCLTKMQNEVFDRWVLGEKNWFCSSYDQVVIYTHTVRNSDYRNKSILKNSITLNSEYDRHLSSRFNFYLQNLSRNGISKNILKSLILWKQLVIIIQY